MKGYHGSVSIGASSLTVYILLAMHERQTPLESIGNTPLLRLGRIGRDLPASVQLLAKAEWMNPGGSVKDRPAASMILDGEQRG
jgi:cysteine synthase